MGELYLIIIMILIVSICGTLIFAISEIPKHYYKYKEELLKEDRKLQIEEERTKQEQIKVAQKIAEKEKEEEHTKQLQLKAEYREKTGSNLY